MPRFRITELRTVTRTYEVESETAEEAVDDYDNANSQIVDEDNNVDTIVIAVENAHGVPIGEWCVWDEHGNQSDGYPTREQALPHGGYPQWISPDD